MNTVNAKFFIGQLITHKLFKYRGVIIDVDPCYQGSEDWYNKVALTRPPKNAPWYRVLVHDAFHETYVAERNLEFDETSQPVNHPLINDYFDDLVNGNYITIHQNN